MSTGEDSYSNHIIYGLVGTFYISVDQRGITTSGIDNNFIVNKELHEIFWSGKFTKFTKPEYGVLLAIVAGELNTGLDELEWWTLISGGILKEVASGGTNNSDGWGNFLAWDRVEETEFNMKVSA